MATLTLVVVGRADVQPYILKKVHLFTQTSSATPVTDPNVPYGFGAQAATQVDLHPPAGTAITLTADSGTYKFGQGFSSLAALDASFPNGAYTMSGTGVPTLNFTLTSSAMPASIPQITNGTWNAGGVLVINPAQSNTFNLGTFSGYASSGVAGHEKFNLATNGNDFNQEIATQAVLGLTASSTPFTSITIPANTVAAGSVYRLQVVFDTLTTLDLSSVPGNGVIAISENQLEVWVAALANGTTPPAAPVVNAQPTNQAAAPGSNAVFTANIGYNGGQFQGTHIGWYFGGQELDLSPNNTKYSLNFFGGVVTLTIRNVGASDAGNYFLKFIGTGGIVATNIVTLSVTAPTAPTISTQPAALNVATGSSAVFAVGVSGTAPLTYQWLKNNVPIPGAANAPTLWLQNTSAADSATYSVRVSNSIGNVTSSTAQLTVAPSADPGRLINLAILTTLVPGETMTMGTVLGPASSSGTMPLLVRAGGPSLTTFGISSFLPDPKLSLVSSGTTVGSNNDWGGDPTLITAFNASGAFGYINATSKDAAVYKSTLGLGNYSALVSDSANGSGSVLAEIYDGAPGTYSATRPRLVNVSVLKQIATGDKLTAGFVIGGSTAKTVLIRAIGPGVAVPPFNVTGTIADPQLTVFNISSVAIASNDNWGGNATLVSAVSSVGAFQVADASSTDAMLLITLPPGNYSAQVGGANNAGGSVIVEVYDVP
jgi:hypothetical protein